MIGSKPDTERPDRSTLRVLIAEKIVGAIYNDPHIAVGPATQATRETGLRKADAILELVNRHAQSVNSRDEIKGSYLNGRADAIEECASVCDKHATWSEEKIDDGDPASARNQMFATISNTANDCAEMIRDLKNSAPAITGSQNNAGMMPPETAHGVGAGTVPPQDAPAQTTSSGLRDRGERETILMYEDALGRIITEDREEHTNADGPCAKIAREAIAKSAAVPPQESLQVALDREEKYLLGHFDADCGIMPGDVQGSFHRIRDAAGLSQEESDRQHRIDTSVARQLGTAINGNGQLASALRDLLGATRNLAVDMFLRERCEKALLGALPSQEENGS